jgi:hypothetical protein
MPQQTISATETEQHSSKVAIKYKLNHRCLKLGLRTQGCLMLNTKPELHKAGLFETGLPSSVGSLPQGCLKLGSLPHGCLQENRAVFLGDA